MSTATRHAPGTGLLAGAGILIVAAIITTAVVGSSDVTSYPAGSPEAAAQAYMQALFAEDHEAAYTLLTPELQAQCDAHHLLFEPTSDMDRAVFEEVRVQGDTAVIDVTITWMEYSPDPLIQLSSNDIATRLVLERLDGDWHIADADWPLNGCEWR